MRSDLNLSHSWWECKYHVVWALKYRKKTLYGQVRKYLCQVFKDYVRNKECEIIEGYMMAEKTGTNRDRDETYGPIVRFT